MIGGAQHARGQGQALQEGRVPFRRRVELKARHGGRVVAVVGAAFRARQARVGVGDATQQAHAGRGVALHQQFQAAIALLAVGHVAQRSGVQVAAGLFDLERAERGGEVAKIVLAAHFDLLGDFGGEHFARVDGAFGRGGALAQPFDVIAVQRQALRGAHRQGKGGRDGRLLVFRRGAARGGIEVGRFDALVPEARDDLDAVIGKGQLVGQRHAV
ncbi:hypothetical protein D3C78_1356200 [compost metagenome]